MTEITITDGHMSHTVKTKEDKEPVYKARQLQALCYISLVLNVILLSVVFAIL